MKPIIPVFGLMLYVFYSSLSIAQESHQTIYYWSTFAVELTGATNFDGSASVAAGFGRGKTEAEAIEASLLLCRKTSKHPENCKTIDTFNRQCSYLSVGDTPWGQAGYGRGSTPQEAYTSCHNRNLDCNKKTIGGCANPKEDTALDQVTEAPRLGYWIAIAFGSGKNETKGFYQVNTRSGQDRADAENRAVSACKDSKYSINNCRAVSAFNVACGYISAGLEGSDADAGYGVAPTAQAAYDRCVSAGLVCDTSKVIGACIK